jgi:hypothetical protein
MFVDIAKELLKNRSDVHFVIAGDGPLMGSVKSKIDNNFSILGMIKNTEEIYSMSDLTVNCSSLEGLALTSFESLAMGVPVVSTDVGGQTELIDENVGGIVHYNKNASSEVYDQEVKQYVKEIERVIDNLDKLKVNCRKRIINTFDIELLIKNFSKIIDQNIQKEKNTVTRINNTYVDYNFALESFYNDYLYYSEQYYINKLGLYYDESTNRVRTGKRFRIRNKVSVYLRRRNAKDDAAKIINYLKCLKSLIKLFIRSLKLFFLAIPAIFILIFKMIFKVK